jgi:hypothetical protein
MSESELLSIWKPIGKAPSGLWQGEANNFNAAFISLYHHFETNAQYSFVYQDEYNYNENISRNFGSMSLMRISKWLAYYGLVLHEQARNEKKKIMHILKSTQKGWDILEKGAVLTFDKAFPVYHIGVGKPYPVYSEIEKMLENLYLENKVAQWRQAKWNGDFHRLYNNNLDKQTSEMKKIITGWFGGSLASIPRRGKPRAKDAAKIIAMQFADGNGNLRFKPLTDWV